MGLIEAAIAALAIEATPARATNTGPMTQSPAPVESAHIHLFTYHGGTTCWCGATKS